jgi:4-hydroxy-tetrahydrodipicolinate synthase
MSFADPPAYGMSITPFDERGEIDEPGLRRHLRYMAGGCVGVFMGALNSGEGYLLSRDEIRRLYEIGLDELKGATPVYAACLEHASTAMIIELAKESASLGLDGAQVYPPAPADPSAVITAAEVERFFRDVFEAVTTPVFLCNYLHGSLSVDRPGGKIPVELIARLVEEYDHIAGVNAGGNLAYLGAVVDAVGKRVPVRTPGGAQLLDNLKLGGYGFISTEPNVAPRLSSLVIEAYLAGDKARTTELVARLERLRGMLMKHQYPRSLKPALNHLGFSVGVPRRPFLPLDNDAQREIGRVLDDLDIKTIEGLG